MDQTHLHTYFGVLLSLLVFSDPVGGTELAEKSSMQQCLWKTYNYFPDYPL